MGVSVGIRDWLISCDLASDMAVSKSEMFAGMTSWRILGLRPLMNVAATVLFFKFFVPSVASHSVRLFDFWRILVAYASTDSEGSCTQVIRSWSRTDTGFSVCRAEMSFVEKSSKVGAWFRSSRFRTMSATGP